MSVALTMPISPQLNQMSHCHGTMRRRDGNYNCFTPPSQTHQVLSDSQMSFNSLTSSHQNLAKETPRYQRKANANILTSFHFARLMRISAPILPATIAASQIDWNIPNEQLGKYKFNRVFVYLKKTNSNRIFTKSESNPKSIVSFYNPSPASDQSQKFIFDDVLTSTEEMPTICSKILNPLLESVVLKETSATLLNLGPHNSHKSKIMIGRDDNHLTPGLIPSAISWIYRLVRIKSEALKQKYIVKLSFVEVSKNKLRDLLKHLSAKRDEKLRKIEDSTVNLVCDFMDNRTVMKASTSDQAAYLFDEAMRYRVNQWKSVTDDDSSTHLIFSLIIFRVDENNKQEFISKLNILDMGSNYNKLIVPNCRQILRDPRKFEDLNLLESTIHYFTTKSKVKTNTVLLGHVSDDGNEYYENIQVLKTLSKTFKRNKLIEPNEDEQKLLRPKLGKSSFSRSSIILEPKKSLDNTKLDSVDDSVYDLHSSRRSTTSSINSIFKIWKRQKSSTTMSNSSDCKNSIERRSTPRTNVKAWPSRSTVLLGKEVIMENRDSETWIDGPRVGNSSRTVTSPRSGKVLTLPNLNFSSNEEEKTETVLSDISEKTEKSKIRFFKSFGKTQRPTLQDSFQPINYSSPKMNRVVDWVNSIESDKKQHRICKTEMSSRSENNIEYESIPVQVSKICESLITTSSRDQSQYNPQSTDVKSGDHNNMIQPSFQPNLSSYPAIPQDTKRKKKKRFSFLFSCLSTSYSDLRTPNEAKKRPEPDMRQNLLPQQNPSLIPCTMSKKISQSNISNSVYHSNANRKSIMSGFAPSSGYDSMPGNDGSGSEMSSSRIRQNLCSY